MNDEVTITEDAAEEEPKQKRKRRTKAEMEAARAAEEAEKAKADIPVHEDSPAAEFVSTEPQTDSASDNVVHSEKPNEGVILAPSIGYDACSSIWIQNTSRNTIIVPLSATKREKIFPSRSWNVPEDYVEYVKNWMKTEYFGNQVGAGNIKVLDRNPSKLGEADLKKIPTPKPPENLSMVDSHITHAGFVRQE